MSTLMEIARRAAARLPGAGPDLAIGAGDKEEKGDKVAVPNTFPPLSPFSPGAGNPIGSAVSGTERNGQVALKLLHEADALVGQLGVSGRHPAVADAAAMVASAFATRHLETVRFAVAEFVLVVRRVAHERDSATGTGQRTPAETGGTDDVARASC